LRRLRFSRNAADSRAVRAGSLFFALPGRTVHGLKFAAEAAARGASVILWEPDADADPPALPASVFAASIPGLKDLVGRIADRFFNWPSSQLRITGITGTRSADAADVRTAIARLRGFTSLPIAVGFGIKNPAQAAAVGKAADGAVVGSAIVDRLAEPAQRAGQVGDIGR